MKYKCPKCDSTFDGEVKFCPNCGQPFNFPSKNEEVAVAPISAPKVASNFKENPNTKSNNDVLTKDGNSDLAKEIISKNMKKIKSHELFTIINYVLLIIAMMLTLFIPFLSLTNEVSGGEVVQAYSFFNYAVMYIQSFIDESVSIYAMYGAIMIFVCVFYILISTIIGITKIFKSISHLKDINTYAYELYDDIINKRNEDKSFAVGRRNFSNGGVSSCVSLLFYLILLFVLSKIPYMGRMFIPFTSYNVLIVIPALVLAVVLALAIIDNVKFGAFKKEIVRKKYKGND